MNKHGKTAGDAKALLYFGKAYVKTPRVILERTLSNNRTEQMIGRLHWLLFTLSNYEDGFVRVNNIPEFCGKGEYITTYEDLADMLNTSIRSLRRYVIALLNESLIEVRRVADRTCFRVCGYAFFVGRDLFPAKPEEKKRFVAEQRRLEEEQITKGHQPRFDLLNQADYEK